uniref:Hexosyltransferase n=1 Tax=Vitrella brassicaformis TaxID=1169539 RepID=A0A7S1K3X8_9ALVE|mmetsp:Transcript_37191/g.93370  ORF Transcript_37191/g.93370 Transcript_37191/m.93370 type:complete len:402 (+) Transcript_37191:135-1340(+)
MRTVSAVCLLLLVHHSSSWTPGEVQIDGEPSGVMRSNGEPPDGHCTNRSSATRANPSSAKRKIGSFPPPTIYLATATDRHQYVGLLALLRSLWRHVPVQNKVELHIFVASRDVDCAAKLMKCAESISPSAEEMRSGVLIAGHADQEINQWRRRVVLHGVSRPNVAGGRKGDEVFFNFIRFHLPRLLPPPIERAIWLDADTIIQGDISELYFDAFRQTRYQGQEAGLAVVPRRFSRHFKLREAVGIGDFRKLRKHIYVPADLQMFNAGVLVFNLTMWRRNKLDEKAEGLIRLLHSLNITRFSRMSTTQSSQLPMNLLFLNRNLGFLDRKWNFMNLAASKEEISRGKILHWAGIKPWIAAGRHREWWLSYHSSHCCPAMNQFIHYPYMTPQASMKTQAAACGC